MAAGLVERVDPLGQLMSGSINCLRRVRRLLKNQKTLVRCIVSLSELCDRSEKLFMSSVSDDANVLQQSNLPSKRVVNLSLDGTKA